MISHDPTDDELVRRYRAGDEGAAAILFRRYAPRLLAMAKSRCSRSFASRFDPEDVAQAAFRALFARLRNNPDSECESVWALLLVLTLNKIRTLVEHHTAAKRSVRRTSSSDRRERPLAIADRRANPAADVAVQEEVDALPEAERAVIQMRLDGYEVDEIVEETGRSRRTVERVLQSFRARLAAAN